MLPNRVVSLLCVALLLAVSGCGEKIAPGNTSPGSPPTVKASVATARAVHRVLTYDAVGTVKARVSTTLSSKLMGTVASVRVREGDAVKKGELLVEIDPRQVRAQLDQAKAALNEAKKGQMAAVSSLAAARAAARLAKSTYERYLNLIKEASASRQEFDEIRARMREAEANLARAQAMVAAADSRVHQAQAAVSGARVSDQDAQIRAPYAGTVTARLVEPQDLASPGTPLLSMQGTEGYRVDLVLPEDYFHFLKVGMSVDVRIPSLGEFSETGTVQAIVPSADTASRTFIVKVALTGPETVQSGMFARVAIPVGVADMLSIPASAEVIQGQLTGVFIIDADGRARFRLIRTGRRVGNDIEVLSGLESGERFVVALPPGIADGARVEVSP
jgi:RND family efflux transporter MFP subunit